MKNLFNRTEQNRTEQNRISAFCLICLFVLSGLIFNHVAYSQTWKTGSSFYPELSGSFSPSTRVGIGITATSELTEKLAVKGNIVIRDGGGILSNSGFGLSFKTGNATTTTSPTFSIMGSQNCVTCIPGSVIIQSGERFNGSSTFSSAPLEVGYDAIRIGTGSSLATLRTGGYLLGITGKMIAEDITVKLQANWPDFVFAKDYQLKSLSELETYIKANQHLPGIPSECELKEKDGIAVSDMLTKQMQKIEELTLYIIELNKKVSELETAYTKKGGQ